MATKLDYQEGLKDGYQGKQGWLDKLWDSTRYDRKKFHMTCMDVQRKKEL